MNWFNVHIAVLRSPEASHASAGALGTWLRVSAYCAEQENGGRIPGAASWTDRQWLQSCGCTRKEAHSAHPLLEFRSGDLVALYYPHSQERASQAGREGGKSGGRPKKTRSNDNPPENPPVSAPDNPPGNPKGKERKGIENEGKESASADPPSAPPVSEEEAWRYAKNQPVAPPWSRELVGRWYADRTFRAWETAGGRPITPDNWREDLRNSHRWAQDPRTRLDLSNSGTPHRPPKKITAPPAPIEEPPHVAELLTIVLRRHPGFSGTWQDVPSVLRRAAQEEWNESHPDNPEKSNAAA